MHRVTALILGNSYTSANLIARFFCFPSLSPRNIYKRRERGGEGARYRRDENKRCHPLSTVNRHDECLGGARLFSDLARRNELKCFRWTFAASDGLLSSQCPKTPRHRLIINFPYFHNPRKELALMLDAANERSVLWKTFRLGSKGNIQMVWTVLWQ